MFYNEKSKNYFFIIIFSFVFEFSISIQGIQGGTREAPEPLPEPIFAQRPAQR